MGEVGEDADELVQAWRNHRLKTGHSSPGGAVRTVPGGAVSRQARQDSMASRLRVAERAVGMPSDMEALEADLGCDGNGDEILRIAIRQPFIRPTGLPVP